MTKRPAYMQSHRLRDRLSRSIAFNIGTVYPCFFVCVHVHVQCMNYHMHCRPYTVANLGGIWTRFAQLPPIRLRATSLLSLNSVDP